MVLSFSKCRETGKNGSKKEVEQFIASQRHGVTSEVALLPAKSAKHLKFSFQKRDKEKVQSLQSTRKVCEGLPYLFSVELLVCRVYPLPFHRLSISKVKYK